MTISLGELRAGYQKERFSDRVRDWFRIQLEKASAHFKPQDGEEE
jgi:hypothetical protein